jgi:hypothetical protein
LKTQLTKIGIKTNRKHNEKTRLISNAQYLIVLASLGLATREKIIEKNRNLKQKTEHLRIVNTCALAFRIGALVGFNLFKTLLVKLANGATCFLLLVDLSPHVFLLHNLSL